VERITDHLYHVRDTCSVYVLRADGGDCLIDCGTDSANQDWPVEWVLLTHYHRDQCAAASAWQKRGAEVYVPFYERRFFEEADVMRAAYDIYNNYTSYYPGFTTLADIEPAGYAKDYCPLEWRGVQLDVIPLPGHTFGSVGYLFEVDGQRALAVGDILLSPQQLWEYYSSQWTYMDFTGHSHLLESLKYISSLDVDLILPGHGEPFRFRPGLLDDLRRRLERLYELFYDRPYDYFAPRFRPITPHVFEVTNSSARTYIVKDDEGHAVVVDCGYMDTYPIQKNPHRFVDHFTPHLKHQLGIDQVEWFICSHYHDDHLAGYPCLRAHYGTKMLCSPELADILAHPENYDMPCLLPEGLPPDQILARGEPFVWRDDIVFFLDQQPGQTLYNQLVRFEAYGRRFMSIGDDISGLCFQEARSYIYSFIPKNRTPLSSYSEIPVQILDYWPDFILTGHGGAILCDEGIEKWREWMGEWQRTWTYLLGQPHPDMGLDPKWVEFYPYKVKGKPGQRLQFQVKITNYHDTPSHCQLRFSSVGGVQVSPAEVEVNIPPRALGKVDIAVTTPDTFRTHSLPIIADVTWNGLRLGPIAEGLIYW